MRTQYLSGGTGVVLDDKLADEIARSLMGMSQTVAKPMIESMEQIAADARRLAPYETGSLHDSIGTYVKVHADEVRVGVMMGGRTGKKAYMVKFGNGLSKKEQRAVSRGKAIPYRRMVKAENDMQNPLHGQNVFKALMRDPAMETIDVLIKELGPAVAKTLGGR